MTRPLRLGLFAVAAAGLALVLAWGFAGLPSFGQYRGPYGFLIVEHVRAQRHIANAVTAVVFDYRGFDTLGEELILLVAASGTAMLLRETRDAEVHHVVDRVRSDAVGAFAGLAAPATLVLGLDVVAHGLLTPGGGFQGGVVLAAAFAWVFLGAEYWAYARLASTVYSEHAEAFGALAFVALGLIALALGLGFLENFLPLRTFGRLTSGGSVALVNWASALAVAGGFGVIFAEYLKEAEMARWGVGGGGSA